VPRPENVEEYSDYLQNTHQISNPKEIAGSRHKNNNKSEDLTERNKDIHESSLPVFDLKAEA